MYMEGYINGLYNLELTKTKYCMITFLTASLACSIFGLFQLQNPPNSTIFPLLAFRRRKLIY